MRSTATTIAASGIEILPARGSPEDIGYQAAYDMVVNQDGPTTHRPSSRKSVREHPELHDPDVFTRRWPGHEPIATLPRTGWKFRKDRERKGEQARWARPGLDLSEWHDVAIEDWWDASGFHHIGTAWYRLEWEVPQAAAGRTRLVLAFGAVDGDCAVYLDGTLAGAPDHGFEGWQEPFEIDAAPVLVPGNTVTIAVKVENYTGPAGIWRPVQLLAPA